MAVGPALVDAAERFRSIPGISLGLHFALNAEWPRLRWGPVCPPEKVRSLVQEDGTFYPNPWQLPPHVQYALDEVELELRAQLDRLRALGLTIRYLDAHMACLKISPEMTALARRVAAEEGLIYVDDLPTLRHGPYVPELEDNLTRWNQLLRSSLESPAVAIFHPAVRDGVVETLSDDPAMAASRQAEAALLTSPRFAALLKSHHMRVGSFAG